MLGQPKRRSPSRRRKPRGRGRIRSRRATAGDGRGAPWCRALGPGTTGRVSALGPGPPDRY